MKATLLDDKLTPLTAPEAIRALREGFRRVMGWLPEDGTLAVFAAQSALETGRWQKIHCQNFGNIKAGENYEGFYCLFRCNEVINGKIEWFEPPHPQCRFRAYPTPAAGAEDYLRLLRERQRFAPAWRAALRGDPEAFCDELKRGGYFTADLAPYKRAVISLFSEFRNLIREMGPPTLAPPADMSEPQHSATSNEDMGQLLPLVWDEAEFRELRDAEIRERDQ